MKTIEHTIYRNQTEMPTEEGWYYASRTGFTGIEPTKVYIFGTDLRVIDRMYTFPLWEYIWFGPVPTCIEG